MDERPLNIESTLTDFPSDPMADVVPMPGKKKIAGSIFVESTFSGGCVCSCWFPNLEQYSLISFHSVIIRRSVIRVALYVFRWKYDVFRHPWGIRVIYHWRLVLTTKVPIRYKQWFWIRICILCNRDLCCYIGDLIGILLTNIPWRILYCILSY